MGKGTSRDISLKLPALVCSRSARKVASNTEEDQFSPQLMNSSKSNQRSWWLARPPQAKQSFLSIYIHLSIYLSIYLSLSFYIISTSIYLNICLYSISNLFIFIYNQKTIIILYITLFGFRTRQHTAMTPNSQDTLFSDRLPLVCNFRRTLLTLGCGHTAIQDIKRSNQQTCNCCLAV